MAKEKKEIGLAIIGCGTIGHGADRRDHRRRHPGLHESDGAGGDHFEEKVFQGPLGRITRDALDYINRNYLKEGVTKHADRPQAERFWNFPLAELDWSYEMVRAQR